MHPQRAVATTTIAPVACVKLRAQVTTVLVVARQPAPAKQVWRKNTRDGLLHICPRPKCVMFVFEVFGCEPFGILV